MDIKQFRQIVKEFEKSTLSKLEIHEKDFSVKMEKNGALPMNAPIKNIINDNVEKPLPIVEEMNYHKIKSPLVGTFYDASSPDHPSFVKVGQSVNPGDILCIVEAMKVMNEIRSDVSGIIKKIHVKNETMVEYGQLLFEIEAK